ncbi:MAG: TIR domain-containing protein [Nitrospira sp.]|nr:TIR domain-containing protein [Nitrospira sp.]
MSDYQYDVALSFAGKQRTYVAAVYDALSAKGINVFYDGGEVAALWGKDLYQHLSDIYLNKAKYCIVFLSKEYSAQLWTRHELKAIQARAFREAEEYLLPVRFDDTTIPGLLPTVVYLEAGEFSPSALAQVVAQKLSVNSRSDESIIPKAFRVLEANLADAVIYATEYLQPQGLGLSDAIAESIRQSFRATNIHPERRNLLPYITSNSAAHRVTGYIAYQMSPQLSMCMDFVASLRREREEATHNHETRPLWQLLVCIGHALSAEHQDSGHAALLIALSEFDRWICNEPSIDLGGECKTRIQLLLERHHGH